MTSEPLTIRLNDSLVKILKKEARRLSFEEDKDILYTDLIRDAVQSFVSEIKNQALVQSTNFDLEYKSSDIFSSLKDMPEEWWLSSFGFIRNEISMKIQEQASNVLESNSLPRSVLTRDKYIPGKKYDRDTYNKNLQASIYTILRRGHSEIIKDEFEYTIPTFQIACKLGIPIEKILNGDVQFLSKLFLDNHLAEEEINNFQTLLEKSTIYRISTEAVTLDALSAGYNRLLQEGYTPKHLIMSPTIFTLLSKEATSRKGNWLFLNLQTNNPGHYQGASIRIINRNINTVYFVAENAGYFIERQPVTALIYPEPAQLRASIMTWTEIGMTISDTMISCVKFKEN